MFTVTCCCTPPYASPEVLTAQPHNPLVNDLWSLGVVLHEMVCGGLPFSDENHERVISMQRDRRAYPLLLPGSKLWDLVAGMLQYNIEKRFVMRDVLLHLWTARAFARYETRRLGLQGRSYRLPPEELTMLPYRLNIEQCNELNRIHNLHHIYQRKYATSSLEPVCEISKTNRKTRQKAEINRISKGPKLPDEKRHQRELGYFKIADKNTSYFDAKNAVIRAIDDLDNVQDMFLLCDCPAVQDAKSILHVVLIFHKSGLCGTADWNEICEEACVKLHKAILSVEKLSPDQVTFSVISSNR